ncbi:MAG: beta-ketoacyl synthase N-terminal-like domain-containing protein [Bacteroidota bacterium]
MRDIFYTIINQFTCLINSAYIIGENIVSPLGFTAEENFNNVSLNKSGLKTIHDTSFIPLPFSGARIEDDILEHSFQQLNVKDKFTRLEKMMLLSVNDAVHLSGIDVKGNDTLFVFSSTKGNIELLNSKFKDEFDLLRIQLWRTAQVVTDHFGNRNKPVVISNACISGVVAIIYAAELIQQGKFKNAVVCGMDALTEFVVSGFQSFLAISSKPCKPFDKNRTGISLGEACATIVLSSEKNKNENPSIEIIGGTTSNDANHISGPSRTGEGLVKAIEHVFSKHKISAEEIDFISAHGTATPYNDEMEAIAFSRTNLECAPVNSFKGYYGHTLGAAGVLETVLTSMSMKNNLLVKSLGYSESGVSKPVNVISGNIRKEINTSLKVASGFGGCNAAMILRKNEH